MFQADRMMFPICPYDLATWLKATNGAGKGGANLEVVSHFDGEIPDLECWLKLHGIQDWPCKLVVRFCFCFDDVECL